MSTLNSLILSRAASRFVKNLRPHQGGRDANDLAYGFVRRGEAESCLGKHTINHVLQFLLRWLAVAARHIDVT
ncbi:MAG: hypothetical protein K6T83_22090, partial [Alicyclobacillus sp.]|nr:hypothetical protein [Alicyclobacillus sp.]